MKMSGWFLCVLLGTTFAVGLHAQSPEKPLVRQIDHIMMSSDEPEQLFRLFSEKLGLPVVWAFQSYGTFSSGGVGCGNVNIELIHLAGRGSGIIGFAMEPGSVSELVTGLDARGLKHGSAEPFTRKDSAGNDRLLWTNVDMTNLPPAPASLVFFCKYNGFDVDAGRTRLKRELENRGGGPLGIESTIELVMGVRDIAAAQRDWRLLVGPSITGEQYVWHIGSGPAIRLIAAQRDQLELLRIKVKSLERARAFLKAEGLLGDDIGREITLNRSRVAGIDIRLVE
jgi:hypothetical protein